MYTVKDLKEFLERNDIPDDMPIGILDTSTDDEDCMTYPLSDDSLMVEDSLDNDIDSETYGEVEGKVLFICFDNKLNENPV